MKNESLPYVLPFAALIAFLALDGKLPISPELEFPLRVIVIGILIWVFSRHVLDWRMPHWIHSILLGAAVFVIWVGPDLLAPGYRQHWLFENWLLGGAPAPQQGYASLSSVALLFRFARAVVIVPIAEELFWRGWLLRWLAKPEPPLPAMGSYTMQSLAVSTLLFASEHGSFWLVGLLAGLIYNWWMIRTRSLGDCILSHAVTNGLLSGYVLATGRWEYW